MYFILATDYMYVYIYSFEMLAKFRFKIYRNIARTYAAAAVQLWQSNISIHLELCFWPPDDCKFNTLSFFAVISLYELLQEIQYLAL